MIKLGGGSGANLQREMKKAFDMVDTSGNGRLELDELKAALRKLGSKLTDEDVAMLLETVDLARDGSISFEEFTRMMRW
jgi:Ca2+-binding EF-hand superfamily protein